jgi:tRNA(Ile)-lysidine synthase
VNDLLEHVERSIRHRALFKQGQSILVAVSGGVDSMVLLRLAHSLARRFNWKLVVAHYNHRLRGRSSNADERFVRQSATALGLKVIVEGDDVRAFARRRGLSVEMAGRELRHEFLARTAKRLKIRSIALAHHADDQVELFLLRLLRGSGGEGLAGMKWNSPSPSDSSIQLVRPLLDLNKAELGRFARDNEIDFREDASNRSLDFRRNRIREELLPLLRKHYQPALAKTVSRVMEILGVESDYLSRAAEDWLKKKRRSPFSRLHTALQRQCLRLQLMRMNLRPDFELVEQLRESPCRSVNVTPRLSVSRDEQGLVHRSSPSSFAFNDAQIEISLVRRAGETCLEGLRCRWRIGPLNERQPLKSEPGLEFFDANRVGPRIVLRHWQPGDRFQPIGMAKPLKLQDWFMNQKIPRQQRHDIVVAESAAGEIFWVEGLRISENFKLTPRTRTQLVWHWHRA